MGAARRAVALLILPGLARALAAAPGGAPFRAAQRELMDAGAAVELAGDALLADARGGDFIANALALRAPRGAAGVALKNCGRALADVGAKFRNRGGGELAAYAFDESAAECSATAAALRKEGGGGGGAAAAADACDACGGALRGCARALAEGAPKASLAGELVRSGDACDALAAALEAAAGGYGDAAPDLRRGGDRLRAGGAALVGAAAAAVDAPPRRRRW